MNTRSQTVTARLEPRLRYLCELAAREQRLSRSRFIENAIKAKLKSLGMTVEDNGYYVGPADEQS